MRGKISLILFFLIASILLSLIFANFAFAQENQITNETPQEPIQTCTDSDNGKNYDVKGTSKDQWGENADSCYSEKQITEYYCQDDGTGKLTLWTITSDCQYGCKDGACLPAPTPVCGNGICDNQDELTSCPADCKSLIKCSSDAECGQATSSKQCGTKYMPKEPSGTPRFDSSYSCKSDSKCYCKNPGTYDSVCECQVGESCSPCQYGCKEGECIQGTETTLTCTDSDGTDYYTTGKTCIDSSCQSDYCAGNTAIEYICQNNMMATHGSYGCPDGCENGACIKSEKTKEQVTCIFKNSKTEQKCYLAEYNEKYFCSGVESCQIGVYGYKGEQQVWKSTCGGYAYTTIDGINELAIFECQTTTPQPASITEQQLWYKNAYLQCYDGTEEKLGDETSCKPAEVWKKYAHEFCSERCEGKEKTCGLSAFSIYNECSGSVIIETPVCGNNVCESGEWEICEITEKISCKEGETCKASTAKCYVRCPADCPRGKEGIYAKLDEKFKLQVSQEAKFDYKNLVIKFNDLFVPPCVPEEKTETTKAAITKIEQIEKEKEQKAAIVEKYSITGKSISSVLESTFMTAETKKAETIPEEKIASTEQTAYAETKLECIREPYAVLQLKFYENNKDETQVIKLQLGEKKQISDFVVSFLDYDKESKSGVFLVSLASVGEVECPKNCVCDIYGKIKECRKVGECPMQEMLCPDGTCGETCEVTNITTECKFGCFYQEKCLPYGLRVKGLYCNIDNDMKTQLQGDETCENHFECKTNVCIDGKCISSSTIQKILSWFRRIFGKE